MGVPQQPRLSPCESVHKTPTMDGFFIVSFKCCSKVTSILPTICPAPDPTVHHILLHPRLGVHVTHSLTWKTYKEALCLLCTLIYIYICKCFCFPYSIHLAKHSKTFYDLGQVTDHFQTSQDSFGCNLQRPNSD